MYERKIIKLINCKYNKITRKINAYIIAIFLITHSLYTPCLSMKEKKFDRPATIPIGIVRNSPLNPDLFSRRYILVICYAAERMSDLSLSPSPRYSLSILQTGQVPCILASKGVQAFLDGSRSAPMRVALLRVSSPTPCRAQMVTLVHAWKSSYSRSCLLLIRRYVYRVLDKTCRDETLRETCKTKKREKFA